MQTGERLYITKTPTTLLLCGYDTYNIRELLKSLGGIWSPQNKCWTFSHESEGTLHAVINNYRSGGQLETVPRPTGTNLPVPTRTNLPIPNTGINLPIPSPTRTNLPIPSRPIPTIPTITNLPIPSPSPSRSNLPIPSPSRPIPTGTNLPAIPTLPLPSKPSTTPRIPLPLPTVTTIPMPITTNNPIQQIQEAPAKNLRGLFAYYFGNDILVCGNKTFDVISRLRELRGRFSQDLACWIFPKNKEQDIINIVNDANKPKPKPVPVEEKEEVEEPYINHIQRLPREVLAEARANGTIDELYDRMYAEDLRELRARWEPLIKMVREDRRSQMHLLTYEGDIKPPALAFLGAANYWRYPENGYNVSRQGYKLYRVTIFGTD